MSTLAFQPDAGRYYSEGYWRSGDLWDDFCRAASNDPSRVALRIEHHSLTYGQLRAAALGVSARLAERGVGRRDIVLLLGRNSFEAAAALLGCLHLGAVAAPLPPMFGSRQLQGLVEQTRARALIGFGGETEREKCQAAQGEVDVVEFLHRDELPSLFDATAAPHRDPTPADDLTVLLHSSGTTSVPKGIMHSSNTLRYATEQLLDRWQITAADTTLVVCEWGFVGSLVFGYLVTLLSGATGVLLPRWQGEEALRLIEAHRVSYVLYMPTHGADILRAGRASSHDGSSVRVLVATGLSRERRIGVREVFGRAPLADYGLSEVPGHIAHRLVEPWEKTITTEGLPFPGTEVEILGPGGEPLGTGEVGEVVVNGPSRFLGFLGNDDLTRESFTASGAYRTGDLGMLDHDGQFVYCGRSKDIIRRGGVTLVPAEIEAAIVRHPSVHEVAVVALPDERLGERACAAVILEPGAGPPSLADLQGFLEAEGVAKYSWPEAIELFEDFPRTPSLKVVKRDIVKAILERAGVPA